MAIVRYEPYTLASRWVPRGTFDRWFDRFFEDAFVERPQRSAPGMVSNLYETPEAYWVELPLPGVKAEDLNVTVHENALTVSAKRAWQGPENARALWQGFTPGEWQQTFTLPGEVNADKVEASLDLGVLRLHLPKADHVRPCTIKVNGAAATASAAIEGEAKASK